MRMGLSYIPKVDGACDRIEELFNDFQFIENAGCQWFLVFLD